MGEPESESSSSSLSDDDELDNAVSKSTAQLKAKLANERTAKGKRGRSWEKMLREGDSRRERRRNYSRSRSRQRDYDRGSDRRRREPERRSERDRRSDRDRRPPREPPSRRSERNPPRRSGYVPQAEQQEMRKREYQSRQFPAGGRRATGARGYQNYRRRTEEELTLRAKQRDNAAPKRVVWGRTPERSASPKEVKEAFEDVREKEKENPLRPVKKKKVESSDDDSDSSTDSEEERRKKRKKKKKKKKRKKKKKSKKKRSENSDSDSDEEPAKKKKKKSKKKKKKKKKRKRESSSDSDSDSEPPEKRQKIDESATAEEMVWVEKPTPAAVESVQQNDDSDDDDYIGPKPAVNTRTELKVQEYGDGLMPGEGKAMATYVALGQRIPRRGEVGLTSNEISNYEDLGYVMSGSRHKRMNAVRIRKENQIYSAEEKRALSAVNFEEKMNRDKQQIAAWQQVLNRKNQKQQGEK